MREGAHLPLTSPREGACHLPLTSPRKRPSYRLLDARVAFSNGALELALVGKNLTNEVANLGDNRSIAAEVPGRPRLFVNQPRTLGVEMRTSF